MGRKKTKHYGGQFKFNVVIEALKDIVISDAGAHKMWTARLRQTQRPNTCIISNGFASMGIGVPGAIAAKLAYPECTAVTITDAEAGHRRRHRCDHRLPGGLLREHEADGEAGDLVCYM